MSLELLIPVEEQSQLGMSLLPDQILGKNISLHTAAEGLPGGGAALRQGRAHALQPGAGVR